MLLTENWIRALNEKKASDCSDAVLSLDSASFFVPIIAPGNAMA